MRAYTRFTRTVSALALGAAQIVISVAVNGSIALSAARVARFLRTRPGFALIQRWLMGAVLGALAVRMAAESRR